MRKWLSFHLPPPAPLLSKWSRRKNEWAVTKSASLDTVNPRQSPLSVRLSFITLSYSQLATKRWILARFVFVDFKAFLCFTFFPRHFCFTVRHDCFMLMHLCLFCRCLCVYTVYLYVRARVYGRSSNPVFIAVMHRQLMSCIFVRVCVREGAAMGYLLAPWRLDNCRCLFHFRARTLTHTHTHKDSARTHSKYADTHHRTMGAGLE